MKDLKNYLKLLFFYFGITIPIVYFRFPDIKNEMKYFIITDNILQSKSLFVLKYFDDLYPDKPPLYFWILSIIKTIFNENYYFFNIFICSTIAGFIIVLLTYNLVKNLKDKEIAFKISIVLTFFPFFIGVSSIQRMDMMMSLFISLSLYLFWGFYYNFCRTSYKNLILFYIFIFMGVFTKGVAGIGIPLSIILAFLIFEKNLKFLKNIKFLKGILFITLLFVGWFYLIFLSENGSEYIKLLLGQETIGRIVKSKTHIRPFYFYIKSITYIFYPYGFIFLTLAVIYIKKLKYWKEWDKLEKIGFISSIIPVVILSLASGKLEVYLAPVLQGTIIFIFIALNKNKDSKVINYIFKISEVLVIFPLFFKIFKKREFYNKIYSLTISSGIILILLNLGLDFYNKNYSLKPFVSYVSISNGKVVSYRYSNFQNLSYLTNYRIENYDFLEDIPKNCKYILTKNNSLKNYQLILKNKKYSLYENKKNNI